MKIQHAGKIYYNCKSSKLFAVLTENTTKINAQKEFGIRSFDADNLESK